MPNIHGYLPTTCTVFKTLINEKNKDYFILKPDQYFLTHQLKLYGRKGAIAVALVVSALAVPLLLLADGSLYALKKMGIQIFRPFYDDFHYLFDSSVFNSHLFQLQEFVKKHSTQMKKGNNCQEGSYLAKTRELVNFILHPLPMEKEEAKRQFHQKMTDKLRHLVEQRKEGANHDQDAIEFVEALCEWIYTGPKLIDDMIAFIEENLPENSLSSLENASPAEISDYIQNFYHKLDSKSKFNGIDEEKRLYDPRYLGDVPSYLFKYPVDVNGKQKNIKIIRTPSVTRDTVRNQKGDLTGVAIVEEFSCFLDRYQKQNKVHVYINLMQRRGSEGIRSKAIEDLEKAYPKTLHVITLTKDFDFYSQKNEFSNLNNGAEFKKQFLSEMFKTKNSNYHWSPALGKNWKNKCGDIIDQVHAKYFDNKNVLTKQERLDFIELTYTEIVDAIFHKLQPDSANKACKSCIDRGIGALITQYTKRCHSQKKEWTSAKRKRLMAIALAPALLAMNRVMQSNRMIRMHSATKLILATHCN